MISLLLISIYVLLAAAVAVLAWSALRVWLKGWGRGRENGIAVRSIAVAVVLLLLTAIVATALWSGTEPLVINGHPYSDTFWLRVSGMFVDTSLLLIAVAALAAAVASLHPGRWRR